METVKFTYMNDDLDSSALEALWYDLPNRRLYVEYPNGTMSGYKDVASHKVLEMVNEPSVGAYFNKHIKFSHDVIRSDVNLEPYNHLTYDNTNPSTIGDPVKSDKPEVRGTYEVSFVIEGTTEFSAPTGDIVKALELFVGSFGERNDAVVRVRSIKEVE